MFQGAARDERRSLTATPSGCSASVGEQRPGLVELGSIVEKFGHTEAEEAIYKKFKRLAEAVFLHNPLLEHHDRSKEIDQLKREICALLVDGGVTVDAASADGFLNQYVDVLTLASRSRSDGGAFKSR